MFSKQAQHLAGTPSRPMKSRRPRAGLFSSRGMVDPAWPSDSANLSGSTSRTEGSDDGRLQAENLEDFEPAELVHGLLSASSSDSTALSETSAAVYVDSDDEGVLDGMLQMGCMDGFFVPKKKLNAKENSLIQINEKGEKELMLNVKIPLALGLSNKKVDPHEKKSKKENPNDETKTSRKANVLENVNCRRHDQDFTECDSRGGLFQTEYHTYQDVLFEVPEQRLRQDPPAPLAFAGAHNDIDQGPSEAISQIFTSIMSLSQGSSADDDCDSNLRPENLVLPPLPQPMYPMNVYTAPLPTGMWHQHQYHHQYQQAYLPPNIPYEFIANGVVRPNLAYMPSYYWQNAPTATQLNYHQIMGHNMVEPPAIARMPSQIVVPEQGSFGEDPSLCSFEVVAGSEPGDELHVTLYTATTGQAKDSRQGEFNLPLAARDSHRGSTTLAKQPASKATLQQVFGDQSSSNASEKTPIARMRLLNRTSTPPAFTRSILSADSEQGTTFKEAESEFKAEGHSGSVSSTNVEEGSRTSLGQPKLVTPKSADGVVQESRIKDDSKSVEEKEVLKSTSSSSSGKTGRPPKARQWEANIQRLKQQRELQIRRSASTNTIESSNEQSSISSTMKKAGEGASPGLKDRDGPSFDERPVPGVEVESKKERAMDKGPVSTNCDSEHNSSQRNEMDTESIQQAEDGQDDDDSVGSDQAIVSFATPDYDEETTRETPPSTEPSQNLSESNNVDTTRLLQKADSHAGSTTPQQQETRENSEIDAVSAGISMAMKQNKASPNSEANSEEPIARNSPGMNAKNVLTERKHDEEDEFLVFDTIFTRRQRLRDASRQKNLAKNEQAAALDRPAMDAGCEQPLVVACERPSLDSSDRPSMDASDRFDENSPEEDVETENRIPSAVGSTALYAGDADENVGNSRPSQSTPGSIINSHPISVLTKQPMKEVPVQDIITVSSTDAVFQPALEVDGLSSPSKSTFLGTSTPLSVRENGHPNTTTGKESAAPPMAPSPRASFSSMAPSPRGGGGGGRMGVVNPNTMLQLKPTMTSEWFDAVSSRGSASSSSSSFGVVSPSNAGLVGAAQEQGGVETTTKNDDFSFHHPPSLYMYPTFTSEWHDTVQSPTNNTTISHQSTLRGIQLYASTSIVDEGSEAVEVIDVPPCGTNTISVDGSGSFMSAEMYNDIPSSSILGMDQ